ncbi:hypothetical protein JXB27_01100 [Candidatus Woesearchaeota archaeon]|nr:hypothetical protein [Candidatus Woesearchaeota archaeon]
MEEEEFRDYLCREDLPEIKRRILEGQLLWRVSQEMKIEKRAIQQDFRRMTGMVISTYKYLMAEKNYEDILSSIIKGKSLDEITTDIRTMRDTDMLKVYIEDKSEKNIEYVLRNAPLLLKEERERKEARENEKLEARLVQRTQIKKEVKKPAVKYIVPKREIKQKEEEILPEFSEDEWRKYRTELLKEKNIRRLIRKHKIDTEPKKFARAFNKYYGIFFAAYSLAIKNKLLGLDVQMPNEKAEKALYEDIMLPDIKKIFSTVEVLKETIEMRIQNKDKNITAENYAAIKAKTAPLRIKTSPDQIDLRAIKAHTRYVYGEITREFWPAKDGIMYFLSNIPLVGTPEQIKGKFDEIMSALRGEKNGRVIGEAPVMPKRQYDKVHSYVRHIFVTKLKKEDYLRIFS